MLATTPPTENPIALRAAILEIARARLAHLFEGDQLDALPAWLWSLPAHQIARHLTKDPVLLAGALADSVNAETDRRHPTERFFAHLERHHPHLSHVQRARLADFACTLAELRGRDGEASVQAMAARGFSAWECERMKHQAFDLIASLQHQDASAGDAGASVPTWDRLREAGTRAHARRAFADGTIEADAAAASRPGRPAAPFGGTAR